MASASDRELEWWSGLRPGCQVRGIAAGQSNVIEVDIGDMEFPGILCRAPGAARPNLCVSINRLSINAVRDLDWVAGKTIRMAMPQDQRGCSNTMADAV